MYRFLYAVYYNYLNIYKAYLVTCGKRLYFIQKKKNHLLQHKKLTSTYIYYIQIILFILEKCTITTGIFVLFFAGGCLQHFRPVD